MGILVPFRVYGFNSSSRTWRKVAMIMLSKRGRDGWRRCWKPKASSIQILKTNLLESKESYALANIPSSDYLQSVCNRKLERNY
jgi:hypothetical protein